MNIYICSAAKRFGQFFKERGFDIIVCGKVRDGDKRKIYIQEGDTVGKDIVIVDDLVQTGGTLYECAVALKSHGATSVNAYVTHAVFPNSCWRRFLKGQERDIFDTFWITNSQPTVVVDIPRGDVFEVVDLTLQITADLDGLN